MQAMLPVMGDDGPQPEMFPALSTARNWTSYVPALRSAAMERVTLSTERREQFVDVTDLVAGAVRALAVEEGAVVVHVPHTTAAVTINEGFDPDVASDVLDVLRSLVPHEAGYAHAEGNSDSHVKAILTGSTQIVPVADGSPLLGRWQRIFFCEFDGPRMRELLVGRVG
jgi:secondary thiamine-phosphate synthase enzyme